MKFLPQVLLIVASALLVGCGTYYDPYDGYTYGLRWYDRGRYDLAEQYWKPMAANGDSDAEFRYGWMLWTNLLGRNREAEAIQLFRKAADQGQPKALLILGDLYYQSPKNPVWIVNNPPFPKDMKVALAYYLKAETTAYYPPEKAAVAYILPRIEAELSQETVREVEAEVKSWKPTVVGREPRRLL